MKAVEKFEDADGSVGYMFHCPGCNGTHSVYVSGSKHKWEFNNNEEKPTFTPSILVRGHLGTNEKGDHYGTCHSFVTDGKIKFLGDCTHSLKNQTVDLPEWS